MTPSPLKILCAAALACAGACKKDKQPPKLENIVRGDKPELPEAVEHVKLGSSIAELDQTMPANEHGFRRIDADGVEYEAKLDYEKTHLKGITFGFPEGVTIDQRATKAWGEPLTGETAGGPAKIWGNPATGLLVHAWSPYGVQQVEFSKYAPIETTLAKRGRGFAFEEPQPILGSTKDQLRVAYPTYEDAGAQRARIRLPKSICASIWTTVDVRFGEFGQAGKASSYSFDLKDDHCKTPKEELEKALSTFGSAGPDAKNPSVTLFSQDPIVALQQGKARWTIAVVGVVDHGEPS